jgi:hypothetical protein
VLGGFLFVDRQRDIQQDLPGRNAASLPRAITREDDSIAPT